MSMMITWESRKRVHVSKTWLFCEGINVLPYGGGMNERFGGLYSNAGVKVKKELGVICLPNLDHLKVPSRVLNHRMVVTPLKTPLPPNSGLMGGNRN
jgi:hypothetical protein